MIALLVHLLFPHGEGEEGQTLAEYALVLALIAVVVVTAVTLLGTNINTTMTRIAGAI